MQDPDQTRSSRSRSALRACNASVSALGENGPGDSRRPKPERSGGRLSPGRRGRRRSARCRSPRSRHCSRWRGCCSGEPSLTRRTPASILERLDAAQRDRRLPHARQGVRCWAVVGERRVPHPFGRGPRRGSADRLDTDKGSGELAKGVAALANIGGGALIVSVATTVPEDREEEDRVRGHPVSGRHGERVAAPGCA